MSAAIRSGGTRGFPPRRRRWAVLEGPGSSRSVPGRRAEVSLTRTALRTPDCFDGLRGDRGVPLHSRYALVVTRRPHCRDLHSSRAKAFFPRPGCVRHRSRCCVVLSERAIGASKRGIRGTRHGRRAHGTSRSGHNVMAEWEHGGTSGPGGGPRPHGSASRRSTELIARGLPLPSARMPVRMRDRMTEGAARFQIRT